MSAAGHEPEDIAIFGAAGIDTGPHTGIALAWWDPASWKLLRVVSFLCRDADSAAVLRGELDRSGDWPVRVAGIEAFVARIRATRLRGVRVAAVMGQVRELTVLLEDYGIPCIARPAGTVKPWATDRRLEAAGLLAGPASPHILDARRHLLFSACQAGLPDPLSRVVHRHDGELNCQACYYGEPSQWSARTEGKGTS